MIHLPHPTRALVLGRLPATVARAPEPRAALFGSTCSEPTGLMRIWPDDGDCAPACCGSRVASRATCSRWRTRSASAAGCPRSRAPSPS